MYPLPRNQEQGGRTQVTSNALQSRTNNRPLVQQRNTLKSRLLPDFKAASESGLPRRIIASSPTKSDRATTRNESDLIEAPQLPARAQTLPFVLSPENPQFDHLSNLGDSSSLFSDANGESPLTTDQFQFGVNLPEITIPFQFPAQKALKMVVEREPPKATPQRTVQPPFANVQQHQFGQPSPIHNRLQPKPNNAVFNIPKPHQQRPEHHRSAGPSQPQVTSHGQPGYTQPRQGYQGPVVASTAAQPQLSSYGQPSGSQQFRMPPSFPQPYQANQQQFLPPQRQAQPLQPRLDYGNADVVEIPRPTNTHTWGMHQRPQPGYSIYGHVIAPFVPVNVPQKTIIDLTKPANKPQTMFDPDAGLFDERFGATDPYMYVDAGKAAENIKALLEGAFEDEDDKPRTRGHRKKIKAVTDGLADNLKGLDVKAIDVKVESKPKKEDEEEEEEEEDEADEDEPYDGTIEGLKVKLLPHQVEGVDWMKDKEIGTKKKNGILPKGGILADDMGLGKTIQSLALILTNPRPALSAGLTSTKDKKALSPIVGKNTLVVAPLALIKQWEAEIKNRVLDSHQLQVCVHHGPQRTKSWSDLKKFDVVITTYQILVSEHGSSSNREDGPQSGCFGIYWYRIILDEAHTIKNRNAKSTQACYALRSEYRWCLTGTPMQNNLDEVQSLIKFLRIKPYNDISVWREQITRPMSQGRGGVAIKRLQFYLKAFMKRRTKDILKKEGALHPGGKPTSKDGPSNGFKITERKVESLFAEFSPEEKLFYERLEQRTDKSLEKMMDGPKMSYASALVLLLRLRQACNHPNLLGGSLSKDSDALTTGQQSPSKKTKAAEKEIDEMADLLGGLNVHTNQCDVCQIELTKDEVSDGLVRCSDCEKDLASQKFGGHKTKAKKHKKHESSRNIKVEVNPESQSSRAVRKRNVIVGSDEEEEGDWVVPEDQRSMPYLGKAGGSDDENAEGGGESLLSDDTETDSEASLQVLGSRPRKVISLGTDDEAEDSTSTSEDDDSSTSPTSSPPPVIASAKIRHLLHLLKRESTTHKFIVYSQFTSMLTLIEPFLRSARLRFTRYDGSMRNDAREASLDKLRHDPHCRILLCSLKCGSLGLNLTAASRVVILEPFWNPFVEEQAIDRVHRLNQTVDVVVYKLTVEGTVEGRIVELQERKRELAREALGGGGDGVGKLSMKDILRLFKRDAEIELEHGSGGGRGMHMLTGSVAGVVGDVRAVTAEMLGRGGRRATPPVMEKGKGKGAGGRAEDSVFGRRW